jgi:hypothetical protein
MPWQVQYFLSNLGGHAASVVAVLRGAVLQLIGNAHLSPLAAVPLLGIVAAVGAGGFALRSFAGATVSAAANRRTCPHGIPIGNERRNFCPNCAIEANAAREIDSRIREQRQRRQQLNHQVLALQAREADRLRQTILLSNAELERLPPDRLAEEIADMFGRLGHKVEPPAPGETAMHMLWKREPALLACHAGGTGNEAQVTQLRDQMASAGAKWGLFVNTADFTPAASQFADKWRIELINGAVLAGLMRRSKPLATDSDAYQTLCRQCGAQVTHHLRRPARVQCQCGRLVPPSLNMDDSLPPPD